MNALNAAQRQKIIEDFEKLTLADYGQLRAELAAAKAEIESLRADCLGLAFTQDPMFGRYTRHIEQKDKELAARDLVISKMRDALITVYGCYPPPYGTGEKCVAAREALALQPTTEALDEFVKRAVEQEREACARVADSWDTFASSNPPVAIAAAIRGRKS